jgi:hypothetical protein
LIAGTHHDPTRGTIKSRVRTGIPMQSASCIHSAISALTGAPRASRIVERSSALS